MLRCSGRKRRSQQVQHAYPVDRQYCGSTRLFAAGAAQFYLPGDLLF